MKEKDQPLTVSDIGIPRTSLIDRHLYAFYNTFDDIRSYISRTDGTLDGRKLQTMVYLMIATIPDMDQGNRCIQMMETFKRDELQQVTTARNHPTPTQEDIRDATIAAALTTLRLILQVMDERYGIQYQNEYGSEEYASSD